MTDMPNTIYAGKDDGAEFTFWYQTDSTGKLDKYIHTRQVAKLIDSAAQPKAIDESLTIEWPKPSVELRLMAAELEISELKQQLERALGQGDGNNELKRAAQAVIERWDSAVWKDLPATAEYINRLRSALPKGDTDDK